MWALTTALQLRGGVKMQGIVVAHAAVALVGRFHIAAAKNVYLQVMNTTMQEAVKPPWPRSRES